MGDFPIGFGRYQLVERLAVGGMAELFVATAPGEHGFQKKVVIKRLLPHLVNDATYNAMFIDEAKLTARLVHPKIAQTFELGKVDDALYIAMEHVDGIDVLALLRELASKRRRIDQPLAAWIAHEVLDALDYAHNITGEDGRALGIVHRDISPSNVLLSVRGDVKLVDFGIARAVDPDRAHKSKSGTLKGKYGYMSPEQVIEQGVDSRSDLFSVGVVLAELLTGRRLFAAANELDVLLMVRDAKLHRLDKYGADIEEGLSAILRKALRKSMDERWQTAGAFRDALAEWLYEHRHRVTSRIVADVVLELRDAVNERRQRQIGGLGASPSAEAVAAAVPGAAAGAAAAAAAAANAAAANAAAANAAAAAAASAPATAAEPVAAAAAAASPAPPPPRPKSDSESGVIVIAADGDSMPNISLSYDPPPAAADDRRGRQVSVGGLAASGLPALPPLPPVSSRAATAPMRPSRLEEVDRHSIPQPLPRNVPTEPLRVGLEPGRASTEPLRVTPIAAHERWPRLPSVPEPGRADRARTDRGSGTGPLRAVAEGAVEVAIADTISAAVEAITLPDQNSEDSVIRAFDDLEPPPRAVQKPTEAEALRAGPPEPPALADIPEPPDDAGEFSATPPLRVLFRLMTARATGLLVVAVGGVKKDIYVRDGMPEYVASNVASELFGNYLVTKGVLSDGELAMALAMMPHYGGKLGDTLVGLGLMKPLEVFRHLTRQVRTKIIDVCSWNKGTFGWYAGRENPREAFPLDFNAFEILGAGAMAMPDEHIESWIAKYGKVRLRASRTRRVGPERFEVGGLVELCELLDGRRSVGDLVELASDRAERLRTGRMLCLLESCDLARPA